MPPSSHIVHHSIHAGQTIASSPARGSTLPTELESANQYTLARISSHIDKLYMCQKCGYVYDIPSGLRNHCRKVHPYYKCDKCGEGWMRQNNLLDHLKHNPLARPTQMPPYIKGLVRFPFSHPQLKVIHFPK